MVGRAGDVDRMRRLLALTTGGLMSEFALEVLTPRSPCVVRNTIAVGDVVSLLRGELFLSCLTGSGCRIFVRFGRGVPRGSKGMRLLFVVKN